VPQKTPNKRSKKQETLGHLPMYHLKANFITKQTKGHTQAQCARMLLEASKTPNQNVLPTH
jgi:hypothetical protein